MIFTQVPQVAIHGIIADHASRSEGLLLKLRRSQKMYAAVVLGGEICRCLHC